MDYLLNYFVKLFVLLHITGWKLLQDDLMILVDISFGRQLSYKYH